MKKGRRSRGRERRERGLREELTSNCRFPSKQARAASTAGTAVVGHRGPLSMLRSECPGPHIKVLCGTRAVPQETAQV